MHGRIMANAHFFVSGLHLGSPTWCKSAPCHCLLSASFTRVKLVQALGFDLRSSSLASLLPFLVMAAGSPLSGVVADGLVARGVPVTNVRKAMQAVAFLVPAVALMVLAQQGLSPQVRGWDGGMAHADAPHSRC